MLICHDGSGNFVGVAYGVGFFRVEGQIVTLDKL